MELEYGKNIWVTGSSCDSSKLRDGGWAHRGKLEELRRIEGKETWRLSEHSVLWRSDNDITYQWIRDVLEGRTECIEHGVCDMGEFKLQIIRDRTHDYDVHRLCLLSRAWLNPSPLLLAGAEYRHVYEIDPTTEQIRYSILKLQSV